MNRKERCRILIEGSGKLLKELAEEIEGSYPVQIIDEPNEGVVMVRMRDTARKTPFYLGEVLVTEAKVQVDGAVGIGIIKGHHPGRAYRLALVDGAWNCGAGEIVKWTERLERERSLLEEVLRIEEGRIGRTRVDFSTMEDQGVEK